MSTHEMLLEDGKYLMEDSFNGYEYKKDKTLNEKMEEINKGLCDVEGCVRVCRRRWAFFYFQQQ